MAVEGDILANKYRLERLLGSGGFATVWAARNLLIDRPVALKIISEVQLRQLGMIDRLLREARIAAKELHPTVVRVEDVGQTREGVPFLVMELIEGPTLAEELKQKGSLPVARSVEITRCLLDGLSAAHAAGIMHRDIKPGNIKLVTPGTSPGPPVRILDLGIAKSTAEGDQITAADQVIGTPFYLPPEVLLNPGRESWSPAADVFAVGLVFFLMVTGRWPFEIIQTAQVYAQFLQVVEAYKGLLNEGRALPGPASLEPLVPAALDAVIRRSLALHPQARYPDAGTMLAALDHATNPGQPVVRPEPRTVATPEPVGPPAPPLPIPDTRLFPEVRDDPTTMVWSSLLKGGRSWLRALASHRRRLLPGLLAAFLAGGVVSFSLLIYRGHERVRSAEPVAAVVPIAPVPPVKSAPLPAPVKVEPVAPSPPVKSAPVPAPAPTKAARPPEPAAPVGPAVVKVRLRGVPDRARVLFAGHPIAGEWIKGEPGARGWLAVQAEGYEPYRRELTLEPGQVIDLSGRLRRVPEHLGKTTRPEERRGAKVISPPREPGIKMTLDP